MGGIYVIDSGSWNTMVDVQSGIYLALELLKDPVTDEYNSITMLPFKLRRNLRETQHENRKDKHWPLTCELNLPIEDIRKIRTGKTLFLGQGKVYQIPEREEINPKYDNRKEDLAITEDEPMEDEPVEERPGQITEVEDLEEEIKQDREREAKVKYTEPKIRSKEERQSIAEAKKAKIAQLEKEAKEKGYEWNSIIYLGCLTKDKNGKPIFPVGINDQQAKTILTDHEEKYEGLMQAIKNTTPKT